MPKCKEFFCVFNKNKKKVNYFRFERSKTKVEPHGKKGFVILTKSFVKIGITKIFCYNKKMISSINKTFGCCRKVLGCSNKKFICCP